MDRFFRNGIEPNISLVTYAIDKRAHAIRKSHKFPYTGILRNRAILRITTETVSRWMLQNKFKKKTHTHTDRAFRQNICYITQMIYVRENASHVRHTAHQNHCVWAPLTARLHCVGCDLRLTQ